jgi:hypothetical protein
MSILAGNGATGAPGIGPALGYLINLLWFNSLFMLISKNNMNTCTYLIHPLSLIYIMKLRVIFGIKIYRKLPSCLTDISSRSMSLKKYGSIVNKNALVINKSVNILFIDTISSITYFHYVSELRVSMSLELISC